MRKHDFDSFKKHMANKFYL